MKTTYRAPQGSLPVRSLGEAGQLQPQSEPRSKPVQLDVEGEQEERAWVYRPFAAMGSSLRQAKSQYLIMEQMLEELREELNVELLELVEHVRKLPKVEELAELQARTNCLLQKNSELKTWVVSQKVELQGMRALKAAAHIELVQVREDRDRAEAIFHKFHKFVRQPGDVLNKARL